METKNGMRNMLLKFTNNDGLMRLEGFPRADVDIPAARAARQKIRSKSV